MLERAVGMRMTLGEVMAEPGQVRAQALEVAAGWSADDAPPSWRLTAGLFDVIAGHDELVTRLAALPPDRLPALLASAAISFLVRRDRPQPLASYFPQPRAPQPPFDEGFRAAARAFIDERIDDILAECGRHRYQMNEVARCTQIALGLTATSTPGGSGVVLADLGTGAGFGLQLDRYRYQLGEAAPDGPDTGPVLHCQVRGPAVPPPVRLPPIADRAGIEVAPADVRDPAARSWLLACAPPEASALTRLGAAIEVTKESPAEVVAGDVIEELPAVLDGLDGKHPVVVTDAYLAVFLPPPRRDELIAILELAGRARPVTWLSLDPLVPLGPAGRDSVQELALPEALVRDYQRNGVFAVLGARTFDRGDDQRRLLARSHPSGQWVEWLDAVAST
jgi:hypothetical protein